LARDGREFGRWDTAPGDGQSGECLLLVDLILRNVGSECSDMKVECFRGIRKEQCMQSLKTET